MQRNDKSTTRPSVRHTRRVATGLGAALLISSVGLSALLVAAPSASAAPPAAQAPPAGAIIVSNNPGSDPVSACNTPDYGTIQDAVDAATTGDTIYVCDGTYSDPVTINEPLTLDGAEYGVSGVGRTGAPETVIDAPGGVTYSAGATTGTLSGFTLNSYTGGVGEISAAGVGSAWTFTDNIVDVSNGGIYFNTDNVSGPGPTTISDNEFTQTVPSINVSSGDMGQAILIWGAPGDNVSISNNDFSDLTGPGANINTSGAGPSTDGGSCVASSQGLSITDNTAEVNGNGWDDNFVALFCSTGALISGNTYQVTDTDDPYAITPIYLGGGDIASVVAGNSLNGNGAPDTGGAIGVSTAWYPFDNATIANNTITGFGDNGTDGQGIVVWGGSGYVFSNFTDTTAPDLWAAPSGFTLEYNTITDSGDGIQIYNDGSTFPSGAISHNVVGNGIVTYACDDQTTGSGTAGTNDTWTDNVGQPNSPASICSPNQRITFAALANKTLLISSITAAATASSGLPVSYTTSTPLVCTSSGTYGATITLEGVGICTVQASQAGNAAYSPAVPVSRSFKVTQASQSITFGVLAKQTLLTASITATATASSGLPVTFITTTPLVCTSSGTYGATITLDGVGTCTVQASQGGNSIYSPAATVNRNFKVTH
jgi:hypothetical protein